MRKLVLTLWAMVVLTGSAAAQDPWANKVFGGLITKDFGTVAKGAQLKYSFKMTNIYQVPLSVTNVRVTCGCVTATPSFKNLGPNESGTLDITMDSRRFTGAKSVTVHVTVGPQFVSTAALTIAAVSRQDVVLNPGEIDFGIVQRGSVPSHSIEVEYAGAIDWRLTEIIKNGSAPFEMRVEELPRQGQGQVRRAGYRLHATLKADAAAGPFKEEILLKTNDPASPTLTFNIIGNVQAPLTAVPGVISLNSLRPGEMQEKKVVIRGSRPFRITGIDGTGQGISAEAADRTAATHILTVRCKIDQPAEVRKNLIIRTNLDNETVNVTVEAKASAER